MRPLNLRLENFACFPRQSRRARFRALGIVRDRRDSTMTHSKRAMMQSVLRKRGSGGLSNSALR